MIREGLWLMAIGMTGVFVFLLLLVGLMHASGRVWVVLARWIPEPEPARPQVRDVAGPTHPLPDDSDDEEIAVVLAVATAARGGRAT